MGNLKITDVSSKKVNSMEQSVFVLIFVKLWIAIKLTIKEFSEEKCTLMAAAMSFYTILAFFPFLLILVFLFGIFIGSSEKAFNEVFNFFTIVAPGDTGEIKHILSSLVRDKSLVGSIGIAGLLWTSSNFFCVLGETLDTVWNTKRTRGFIARRLVGFFMLFILGFLVISSTFIISTMAVIKNIDITISYFSFKEIPFLWKALTFLLGYFSALLTSLLIYKFVPSGKNSNAEIIMASLISSIAWQGLTYAFAQYTSHLAVYNKVYGSLGGLVLFVIWIYYSMIIILFAAEFASCYYRLEKNSNL